MLSMLCLSVSAMRRLHSRDSWTVPCAVCNMKCALIYLDDIIVYSEDIATHLSRLGLIFERLQEAALKLKPSKCSFLQHSVDFLGYKISENGVGTDPR